MAIVRINEFRALADQVAALHAFLGSVIDLVAQAPGCQGCQLLIDHEDPSRFLILETWASLAAHQAAAAQIPPAKLAEARALLAEPPKGRYYDPVAAM